MAAPEGSTARAVAQTKSRWTSSLSPTWFGAALPRTSGWRSTSVARAGG